MQIRYKVIFVTHLITPLSVVRRFDLLHVLLLHNINLLLDQILNSTHLVRLSHATTQDPLHDVPLTTNKFYLDFRILLNF
mgnify:CR=1 FL=1